MNRSRLNILISGFFGAGNLGDELILSSIIHNLRKINSEVDISVISFNPDETKIIHKVNAIKRSGFGIKPVLDMRIWKAIANTDLVLVGGGGLFQDIKGWETIARYLLIVLIAKILGKPVVYFAIGVGTIANCLNKQLMAFISKQVDLITVRDQISKENLRNLNILNPIFVTADPAFLLTEENQDKRNNKFLHKRLNVAICLREWPGLIKREIARCCDWLITEKNANIIFIPMEGAEFNSHDIKISEQVIKLMNQKENVKIIKNKLGPQGFVDLLKTIDLVISVRLHALIISATYNIPMIGLSYTSKVNSLFKDLNLAGNVLPINCNFEQLSSKTEDCLAIYDVIKKQIKEQVKVMQKRAKENFRLLSEFKPERRQMFYAKFYYIFLLLYLLISFAIVKIIKRYKGNL